MIIYVIRMILVVLNIIKNIFLMIIKNVIVGWIRMKVRLLVCCFEYLIYCLIIGEICVIMNVFIIIIIVFLSFIYIVVIDYHSIITLYYYY